MGERGFEKQEHLLEIQGQCFEIVIEPEGIGREGPVSSGVLTIAPAQKQSG